MSSFEPSHYSAALVPSFDEELYFELTVSGAANGRLPLSIMQKDLHVRRLGDFTNIYGGEVLTDIPTDFIPREIAIKRFRFDPNDENIRQNIVMMLAYLKDKWASLDHPNIIPFWPLVSATEPIPAVAMPWFRNGNVLDFIRRYPHINRFGMIMSLARAVEYIHEMGEVHGNIVPTNVLIADDGMPCLSDIGLNAHLLKVTYGNGWAIPSTWVFKALEELSPEGDPTVFQTTEAMDVYAFACTVYTIFTFRLPFTARPYGRGMQEKVEGGRGIQQPAEIPGPLWILLQRCLSYNPGERPPMERVVAELESM